MEEIKGRQSALAFKRIGLTIDHILALVLGACVLLGCLAGCSPTRWVGIESGEYTVVSGGGEANEAALQAIQKIKIDRDERAAVFTLADGSEIVASFTPRSRAGWPAGCPTNIFMHRMEVLIWRRTR